MSLSEEMNDFIKTTEEMDEHFIETINEGKFKSVEVIDQAVIVKLKKGGWSGMDIDMWNRIKDKIKGAKCPYLKT